MVHSSSLWMALRSVKARNSQLTTSTIYWLVNTYTWRKAPSLGIIDRWWDRWEKSMFHLQAKDMAGNSFAMTSLAPQLRWHWFLNLNSSIFIVLLIWSFWILWYFYFESSVLSFQRASSSNDVASFSDNDALRKLRDLHVVAMNRHWLLIARQSTQGDDIISDQETIMEWVRYLQL